MSLGLGDTPQIEMWAGLLSIAWGRRRLRLRGRRHRIIAREFLGTAGPFSSLIKPAERRSADGCLFEWIDVALAAGPLVAGALFVPLGPSGLYALLALGVTARSQPTLR